MKIAAELISPTDLKFFLLESSWESTTRPFDLEEIKTDIAVFFINGNCEFHNTSAKPEPQTTHPSLNFCREKLTVANFKAKSKGTGETEPYEVLLTCDRFTFRKEFENAYSVIFRDIYNNQVIARWLTTTLSPAQIAYFLKAVKETGRYHTEDFSEFKGYPNLDEFIKHLFKNWWVEKVKSFENETNPTEIEQSDFNSGEERYRPITFY